MKIIHKTCGASWRTSILGWAAILIGAWSFKVHWVPNQSAYFNVFYAETGSIALLVVGLALLFARDNKVSSEDVGRLPGPEQPWARGESSLNV